MRKIFSDPSVTPLLLKEIYPGANVTSDTDLWHAIAVGSLTFHHPVGLPLYYHVVYTDKDFSSVLSPLARLWRVKLGESSDSTVFVLLTHPPFLTHQRAIQWRLFTHMRIMRRS